jgi:3-oxoacyl-[acyl-carrier-protein] synthase-1
VRALASVVGAGAVTAIGLGATDTAFSHRAGAAGMREAPLVDGAGDRVTMCFVPILDPLACGGARAALLAARALDEALASIGPAASRLRVRLALNVGQELALPDADGALPVQAIASELVARASRQTAHVALDVSVRGAAGPGYLVAPIAEALASGAIDAAVLGGVHTDYDPSRVAALDAAGRLFRPDRLDALIPGEAAAFVVLVRPEVARRLRLDERLAILHAATAYERARPDNDEPAFVATGLTAALRAGLAPIGEAGLRAGWAITDLTFETFRHFELQAAMTRVQRHLCEPQQVDHPAQRMGHLGAAVMPLHLALAAEAYRRGFAPHRLGLSIAGSDGGERAVLLFAGG